MGKLKCSQAANREHSTTLQPRRVLCSTSRSNDLDLSGFRELFCHAPCDLFHAAKMRRIVGHDIHNASVSHSRSPILPGSRVLEVTSFSFVDQHPIYRLKSIDEYFHVEFVQMQTA